MPRQQEVRNRKSRGVAPMQCRTMRTRTTPVRLRPVAHEYERSWTASLDGKHAAAFGLTLPVVYDNPLGSGRTVRHRSTAAQLPLLQTASIPRSCLATLPTHVA